MGPYDINWILEVLPHRYPLLLIDRILEIHGDNHLVALKNVTFNEEFFQGHFPGRPVMPGVLVLEAMAQAGGILLMHDNPDRDKKLLLFTGIEKARFRRPIVPGDQIRFEIELVRRRSTFCMLRGKALIDGALAAEAQLSSATIDR